MLFVGADSVPELNEVTTVSLTSIVESGIPGGTNQSRGARLLPGGTEAVITVQANDDPHGVISWFPVMVLVDEQEGSNNVLQLIIVREFGAVGAVIISFTTAMAESLPSNEQAVSLMDFVPASGDIIMSDGQTSASVAVTILHVSE